ncbi:hypothetical protein C9374_000077 [Naegleria lovaniensis]|uniref:Kinetochore protein Nuf2 N-terminal domain-containing protein n=1 Tax=Naegleria lovaniensis TaxID=51637 RepID=A0AA88GYC4_NAELO|nr:uncharacterized protein C9374_000077 [Naegleria lovaniensis]KAG2388638.1 hypothetical protein C9374_000077 [Naegleria lovaniensis]
MKKFGSSQNLNTTMVGSNNTGSAASYNIPTVNIPTLLASLGEMGVPSLSTEDLNNPSPEVACKILGSCMEKLLDTSTNEIRTRNKEYLNSPDAPVQIRENPEAYSHAAEFIELFKKIQKVLITARLHDFSITDIVKPNSKRFRLALFAFLNLAKFREEIIDSYNEIITEFDTLEAEKEELRLHVEKDNNALQSYLEEERSNESNLKILAEKVRAMTQAIQEISVKDIEIQNNIQIVQSENENLTKQLEGAEQHLEALTKENKTLKSQIVSNPEELKKKILVLRRCIQTTTDELRELEEQLQSLTVDHIKNAEELIKILSKSIVLSEQVEEFKNKKKDIGKIIKGKQETIENMETEIVEVENMKKQKEKQITNLSERIEKMQQQHLEKIARAETMIIDAQKEKEQWNFYVENIRTRLRATRKDSKSSEECKLKGDKVTNNKFFNSTHIFAMILFKELTPIT